MAAALDPSTDVVVIGPAAMGAGIAWADRIAVQQVLDHMARYYGEVRYRTSPLMRRRVTSGVTLHEH